MLILSKKISISSEQLDELQERHDLVLKVPKKTRLHSLSLSLSLSGKYKFGTSYYNCQTLKQENTFQDFLVFYFGYRAKLKTRKLCKFSIFLLKRYLDLWAFVSVNFLLFFQLKLQLLSKFEVKEHFPGFPSFRFWV